jgi:hypothetical protein
VGGDEDAAAAATATAPVAAAAACTIFDCSFFDYFDSVDSTFASTFNDAVGSVHSIWAERTGFTFASP